MTIALNYLSRMTNEIFQAQMNRAARMIVARQDLFPHHVA
jgi:hypothetical protein